MVRYLSSVIASFCLFGIANYFNITRPVICDDCFFPYGLPFTFFREGGFAGGGGYVWQGIVSDFLVVIAFGMALAAVWKWLFQKHSD
jgi:hypothetical protein